jgi:transcriptional regulator with XRE-family HTH domain
MSEVKSTSLAAFGDQLKAWRKTRRWTQVDLGESLGYSPTLISGIELGQRSPSADFAAACDAAFALPGTFATFQGLVAREAFPAFFAPVVPFEQAAIRIHGWELGSVPGLLQTEAYARAHLRSGRPQDSDSSIDKLVAARLERQGVLTGDSPPLLWYVLDEGVLRHVIGGPEVMAGQLDALIIAATLPGVVVQVLPFGSRDNAGADGAIAIYEFADSPSVCYTECYGGGRVVDGRDEVAGLTMVMGLIRASALPPHNSIILIRQIRSEVND